LHLRLVDRMAADAADIVFQVLRAKKIAVLFTKLVAVEAAPADIPSGQCGKTNDLADITTAFDVSLSRTVTRFATLPLRTAPLLELILPVRPVVITSGFLVMAGSAQFTTRIEFRITWPV